MRHHRAPALALAILVGICAQLMVGRSEQARVQPSPRGDGPFDSLHFRQIGPASMSGRIADLAVYEPNPSIFYVGTAHGGVWKTTNAGTTFEPQMQNGAAMSIGDVTVSQSNPDLVWVGTGESNNRQSTSWGDGVYKSIDGGKTYSNMGLRTSRFINRILIDPRNTDVVFVAATGSLWGPGGERGVFKTIDGGTTWKQVLTVDEDTGANDLVMDGSNSKILYASMYQRRRTACCMNGGGAGSGIWKSTDAGETWTRLSGSGIPEGPLGRIALDVYRRRPNILYALIEGPVPQAGRGGAGAPAATPGAAGGPGAAEPASAETPAQPPTPSGGRGTISRGANNQPTGLYRSDDAGATWRKVNNANPRPMYFSQVRIDPNDPDIVYYGGVGLHYSNDGGKAVATDVAASTHDDVHAIWIDPANSDHVLIGNDGGVAVSWDQAKTWNFFPNLPLGLFYHVSYDMAVPYNICGGLQDNYVWCGPSQVRGSAGIANFQWTTMQGGDGFVALQDPTDYRVAYSESQDGNIVRIDRVTGETRAIRPLPQAGEPPLRWNWDTPFILSPHNPAVVYAAANKMFRSDDRGLNWETAGPDLTGNANRDDVVTMGVKGSDITIARNDGILAWPTIVSIAESPKRAGVLYVGTDDGHLQVSRDAGRTWTDVIDSVPNLPKGTYVSEVVPSRFDEAIAYATFDGHRDNDFKTYIYASSDYGRTWRSVAANLDDEIARTLTEDIKNPDVLYLGTETGLFVSIDRANSWRRLKANLPDVRIDEIVIHPRDNALILATHGRSAWILDHLSPIQEYAAVQAAATEAKLFTPPATAMYRRPVRDRNYEFWGDQHFFGENPPQAAIIWWHLKRQVGEVKLRITNAAGAEIREIGTPVLASRNTPGIHSACWDLRVQPIPPPPPGERGGGRGRGPQADAGATPEGQLAGGRGEPQTPSPVQSPFGAGCGLPMAGGGGGGLPAAGGAGGGGAGLAGPFVLAGVYTVALVVDSKTVDTKVLRVVDDPQIVLTSAERRRMFDMAMEMHALEPSATAAATAHTSLTRQVAELTRAIAGRDDVPGEVKASFEVFKKELEALAPRLVAPAGRGAGPGRGLPENMSGKIGLAKTGLMGFMSLGDQTMRAYTEAKTQMPKAIADFSAVAGKAAILSATLATYKLTLTVPAKNW